MSGPEAAAAQPGCSAQAHSSMDAPSPLSPTIRDQASDEGSQPVSLPDSLLAARAVLEALVRLGVRDVVLAPGSRSAPFVPLALALEEAGAVRVRVVLDERSAGFVALGIARAYRALGRRQVAAVITTSGTAVANLHPAVLEADAAGIPLLALTSDRPHELVGTGANQTTEQTGVFATACRAVVDLPADLSHDIGAGALPALTGQVRRALAAATGALSNDPGPAQVNVRFRPRLALPAQDTELAWDQVRQWAIGVASQLLDAPEGAAATSHAPIVDRARTRRVGAEAGIVVAGDCSTGSGLVAAALAQALDWPVLAEPTSGARGGHTALPRYAELLTTPAGQDLANQVGHIVVTGHPSLTRPISALLARPDLTIDVLTDTARWTDVAGTACHVLPLVATDSSSPHSAHRAEQQAAEVIATLGLRQAEVSWLKHWRDAVAALPPAPELAALTDPHAPMSSAVAALAVWQACRSDRAGGSALVVGSSMAIRHLDRLAPTLPGSQPPLTLANRGLAGIDGTIATAIGAWHAWRQPVRLVVGDLTFLHDAMSLNRGYHESEPDLQVVVLDDAGGAIFSTLEYPLVTPGSVMRRGFTTPQVADIRALGEALGARVTTAETVGQLRQALDDWRGPRPGLSLIHVPVA